MSKDISLFQLITRDIKLASKGSRPGEMLLRQKEKYLKRMPLVMRIQMYTRKSIQVLVFI